MKTFIILFEDNPDADPDIAEIAHGGPSLFP